ncbi:MAG: GNAT family N-acetyltransferase [Schlesneria sp.]
MTPKILEITRVADGTTIDVILVPLTRKLASLQIDTKWWQIPGVPEKVRSQEIDHGYKWAKRIGELTSNNSRWYRAIAVQTDDDNIQGAMIYWLNTRSFIHQNEGAIFVESLATAPCNRERIVTLPEYRGVGTGLLLAAVIHSYKLGLGGRVNLNSTNDPRTISFYETRGFVHCGYDGDEDEEKLPRFELSAEAAQKWLNDEGYEL